MRIAVYGGSFNPLHIGHLAVLQHLVDAADEEGNPLFDKVLLVVSPKNPLKDISADSGRERYEAAIEALSRHPELKRSQPLGDAASDAEDEGVPADRQTVGVDVVEASDIEMHLPQPSYTYVTLDTLKSLYPEADIRLVMGGDQISDIRRWREYRHILSDFGAVVFPREGYDIEAIRDSLLEEDPRYSIMLMEMPPVNVSSTQIREGGHDSLLM